MLTESTTIYFREASDILLEDNTPKIDYTLRLFSGGLKGRRVVIFGYDDLGLFLMQDALRERGIKSTVITNVNVNVQTQLNKFNSGVVQVVFVSDSVKEDISFYDIDEVIYFDVPPSLDIFRRREKSVKGFTPMIYITTKVESENYTLLLDGDELPPIKKSNATVALLERFSDSLVEAEYNPNKRYQVLFDGRVSRSKVELLNAIGESNGNYLELPRVKKDKLKSQFIALL